MNRTWRIGLGWASTGDYAQDAIRGVAEYACRFGPFRLLNNIGGDIDFRDRRQLATLDGILIYRSSRDELFDGVAWPRGVPLVSLEGCKSQLTDWQVLPDDRAIGRLVADEFIRRAFRRFAFCSFGMRANSPIEEWHHHRLQGFCAAVGAAGGEAMIYETPVDTWGSCENEWSEPLAQWLRSLPKPVGIMAANDLRARHLMLAAEVAGVRVPEEAAVIGVDNAAWTEVTSGGISSVEVDGYAAGYAALELLHQRLQRRVRQRRIIRIPPQRVVIRRSSDVLAVDDAEVAAALRFIADQATAGIDVAHVVEAVALSRRTLELRFQSALRRSIKQEIRSVQVQRARLLLADPSVPLSRIANACGFLSPQAMSKIFRRISGSTPTDYRRSIRQENARTPRPV